MFLCLKKTGKWENGSPYGHQEIGRSYISEVNLRDPSQVMKHTSRSIDTGFDARQTVSEVQNRGKSLMSSFLKKYFVGQYFVGLHLKILNLINILMVSKRIGAIQELV